MNLTVTNRGFEIISFQDRNGQKCSLQVSSLATGINKVVPKVIVPGQGVQEVPLPEGAIMFGRMHLTRIQVAELLPHLMRFAREGRL
jgi:hypothetical protein